MSGKALIRRRGKKKGGKMSLKQTMGKEGVIAACEQSLKKRLRTKGPG